MSAIIMRLFALVGLAFLLACSPKSNHQSSKNTEKPLETEPYRMFLYDIEQAHALRELTTSERIMFSYSGSFQKIRGEKLGILWTGKIQTHDNHGVLLQFTGPIQLQINGENIALNGEHHSIQFKKIPLKQGIHEIAIRYEPKWFAGNMLAHFLPAQQEPHAPESIAQQLKAEEKHTVVFVEAAIREKMPADSLDDNQALDSQVKLPKHDSEQIVLLSASRLSHVHFLPEQGAKIKAIVALNTVGRITGTDAPVYRVSYQTARDDLFPSNCTCHGGTVLSCSTEKGIYNEINQLSQTLTGKTPDIWFQNEIAWQNAQQVAQLQQKAMQTYQTAKARCGGEQSPTFSNTSPNVQGGEQSWFSQLGGVVPETGFIAYYFNQNQMNQAVASEHVPHIGINYVSDQFHNIPSEQFAALWAGYLNVKQDTVMAMQYDMSWSQMRVFLNGNKVFEFRHGENGTPQEGSFDLLVPKGKNRLEVEYLNHYHTVGFSFHPQEKIIYYQIDKAKELVNNPQYQVVHAEVYESGHRDNTLTLELPSSLSFSRQPIVLILKSHNSVFWQIQAGTAPIQAIIIQDGKGVVSGSLSPVLRVPHLPHSNQTTWHFYEYAPKSISEHAYQLR